MRVSFWPCLFVMVIRTRGQEGGKGERMAVKKCTRGSHIPSVLAL